MIRNQIHKALSTFQSCGVHALLMGGQACVFYGAAEFSRDTDFAVATDEENLGRLREALTILHASVIAVPPFKLEYLLRGHAVHFRCLHPEAAGLRIDIMSRMRGVAPFHELWERRTTVSDGDGSVYELMALSDLVRAKKTQRDKDWPMIRRLIEADHAACDDTPSEERARFWLREARSPGLLVQLSHQFPEVAKSMADSLRPLLLAAVKGDETGVELGLIEEERLERAEDRAYWLPLRKELEQLRHNSDAQ